MLEDTNSLEAAQMSIITTFWTQLMAQQLLKPTIISCIPNKNFCEADPDQSQETSSFTRANDDSYA